MWPTICPRSLTSAAELLWHRGAQSCDPAVPPEDCPRATHDLVLDRDLPDDPTLVVDSVSLADAVEDAHSSALPQANALERHAKGGEGEDDLSLRVDVDVLDALALAPPDGRGRACGPFSQRKGRYTPPRDARSDHLAKVVDQCPRCSPCFRERAQVGTPARLPEERGPSARAHDLATLVDRHRSAAEVDRVTRAEIGIEQRSIVRPTPPDIPGVKTATKANPTVSNARGMHVLTCLRLFAQRALSAASGSR